jgi:thioredoxin-dependent peroxiredoxin
MKLAILIIVIVGAVGLFAMHASSAGVEAPAAGAMALDFTLPSQDGSPVALHDFRGKWVVLYFYPKDGTHGCTIEAHNFERDLAQYDQAGAVILGVSVDSTGSHQEFCAKQGLTFKLLSDTEKKVSAEYGSLMNLVAVKIAKRNTFLIDPNGKIARVWLGVDPTPHSKQVLDALAELKRG